MKVGNVNVCFGNKRIQIDLSQLYLKVMEDMSRKERLKLERGGCLTLE